MLLKPYFHGTTRRIGAPFCGSSRLAVQAGGQDRQVVHRLVQPQTFDVRPLDSSGLRWPGICCGSSSVLEAHVLGVAGRLHLLQQLASGKPCHGMTIDQASTQRSR